MKQTDQQQLGPIAYYILFGEKPDKFPDPNKPENSAYINAKKKEHSEKFKQFVEGPGSILFETWQSRVRVGLFNIMNPTNVSECNCKVSNEIRELQFLFKLLAEAQAITEENND